MLLSLVSEKQIKGEILYVDHYGNCQTNISPEELRGLNLSIGDVVKVTVGNRTFKTTWCESFQSDHLDNVGLITDSWGMVLIFRKNGNAAEILECGDSSKVSFSI